LLIPEPVYNPVYKELQILMINLPCLIVLLNYCVPQRPNAVFWIITENRLNITPLHQMVQRGFSHVPSRTFPPIIFYPMD